MKPHVFAQILNCLVPIAKAYGHTEQFRDRASEVLHHFIPVEHENPEGLLPCPFCGDPSVYQLDAQHSTAGTPTIACRKCGARMFTGDPKDWNTRAP